MKDETKSKLIFLAIIVAVFCLMVFMLFMICEDIKAEEILVNEYPFWAVSTSGDSTFQTVQIIKCYQIFPNGQRKLLGYKIAVDSSGICIYEEEPVWFLNWALYRTLSLRNDLAKR